jgi:phage tail-like protein
MYAIFVFMALVAAGPAQAQQRDQALKYSFRVEIEGIGQGFFREVSGLGVETEVVEYRDGNTNDIRKLPGRTGWSDIVLKRGFRGGTELYEWATTYARTGNLVRRSGAITMIDANGHQIARWQFERGWPLKWGGPDFDASKNEVALETLVIAHEGLTLADEPR